MTDEQNDSRGETRQSFFAKQQLIDSARTAFQLLAAVMRNVTLYPGDHPILLSAADKLRARIEELLVNRKEVAFYIVGGELFFETISVLADENLLLLMEQFSSREIGGIIFLPGLTSQDLIRFSILANKEQAFFAAQAGIKEVLAQEGIAHIELHKVLLADKKVGDAIKAGKKKAVDIFKDAIDTVKELVQASQLEKAVNVKKVNTLVQTMVDNVLDNRDALMGLTSIKMYDEYTYAHSVNTSILSVSLGTFLSFDKPQIAALGVAALMHDIGKVTVPHEIINKPGKLTDEEWQQVKRHPVEGALILADAPGVSKLAMVAAFEHHQHSSEQGYPKAEGELHRHPFSQIVSLADAYEALTAARVYYNVQMPPDQAIRILIKKRHTAFNAVLVKAFVNMIGIFPVGTLLKLDTGEVALVRHQTRDLMRPRVLILTKFDGSEKQDGQEVSLVETVAGKFKRSVAGIIDPNIAKVNMKLYID